MQITWLGQAGLLIEAAGKTIIIDPYLSNSVAAVNPANARRVPIDERYLAVTPDVLICTHDHLDHADPETLPHYLARGGKITVLAPGNAWQITRKFGGAHNYVLFGRHTEWTEGDVRFIAVHAAHSDPAAIGVVIEAEGKRLYVTGDTLYHREIFADLAELGPIDALFLPVNGVGNNLNMTDAARFCARIAPRVAVPLHWGLFDSLAGADWAYPDKVVPQFFKPIEIKGVTA